jgi:ABC-type methionine transport system ATPase subunit
MDKDNTKSTIMELLSVINEEKFYQLILVTDIDKYVKKFTSHQAVNHLLREEYS